MDRDGVELIRPTVDLEGQWWEMVDEFAGATVHGSSYRHDERADLQRPGAFEAWVDQLAAYEVPGDHIPQGRVPAAYRWVLEDGRLVGTITVRHELMPSLLDVGGHIGYAVRPSARGRGVARAALSHALRYAAGLGLDPVLLTCETSNPASARVIEACGGVLEDVRGTSRRYWVPTGAAAEPLGTGPLEGRGVALVPFTGDEVRMMLEGERLDWWAEGYPREDDLDAARSVGTVDEWSPRHIVVDGVATGSIGCFGPAGEDGLVEVGYGLVESTRGSGVMTEVLSLMCRSIEARGHRVMAHTLPDNVPSHRVLARLGFVHEGEDDGEWRWVRRAPSAVGPTVGAV